MLTDDRGAGQGGSDRMRVPAVILSVVGLVWWVAGVLAPGRVTGAALAAALALGVGVAGLLVVLSVRRLGTGDSAELFRRNRSTFDRANALQGVGIAAVVVLGVVTGNGRYIPALVALVVGLHFLPFVRAFRWAGWGWLSVAFVAVALTGCALAATGRPTAVVGEVVGLGCAVACWAAVLSTFVGSRRLARSAA